MAGCGRADNNGKTVTGSKLICGTRLSYGVGKETKRTVVHLCQEYEENNGNGHEPRLSPSN